MAVLAPMPNARDRTTTIAKPGPLAQTSESEPQVAPKRVEKGDGIHFVDGLADPGGISKLVVGSGASIGGRHSSLDVPVGLDLEVGVEFCSPLRVPLFTSEESQETHGLWSEFSFGRRTENASDRPHQLLPAIGLVEELFSSFGCQPVIPGTTIVLRGSPERSNPASVLEPMECGVKGTVFDLKNIF